MAPGRLAPIVLLSPIVFGVLCSPVRAAEVFAGVQIQAANATHRIVGGTASGPAVGAVLTITVRSGRFDFSTQIVPATPTYSVPPGNGFQNIHLLYSNAVLRYWLSSHFALGIGESVWNQRTYYNYARFGETDTFATRTVGMEYEAVEQVPVRAGVLRVDVRVDPSMHGVESDRGDPFLPLPTRFERAAAVDVMASWIDRTNTPTELQAGVRFTQLTAKYDNGEFAYANRIMGPFVRISFRMK